MTLHCTGGTSQIYTVALGAIIRHINDLLESVCLLDLLNPRRKLFPKGHVGKELTESCAAYNAVRRCLRRFALSDPKVTVVCVGDGSTPRTAAMFAFRSKWQAVSVDPELRSRNWGVNRLCCMHTVIEDVKLRYNKVIVVGVHSHASLARTLDHVKGKDRAVVWIPCCKRVDIETPPTLEYVDPGIWSPKNRVMVWERL